MGKKPSGLPPLSCGCGAVLGSDATCRVLAHHGVAPGECPAGCAAPEEGPAIYDHSHALGVSCGVCGAYWIPPGVPETLRAAAARWELVSTAERCQNGSERCAAVMLVGLRRRLPDAPDDRPPLTRRRRRKA